MPIKRRPRKKPGGSARMIENEMKQSQLSLNRLERFAVEWAARKAGVPVATWIRHVAVYEALHGNWQDAPQLGEWNWDEITEGCGVPRPDWLPPAPKKVGWGGRGTG